MRRKDLLAYAKERLGLQVVPAESDVPALIALTRTIYPTLDIGHPDYIAWEYHQNPAGQAISRLGKIKGRAAGAFTILPQRMQIAGHAVNGGLSVNTMTHSDFRGMGVFPILGAATIDACADEKMACILGFPNPYSHKGFVRDLDFKDIGELPLWILPMDLGELARADRFREHPYLRTALKAAIPFFKVFQSGFHWVTGNVTHRVEETSGVDGSFDALWKHIHKGYPNAGIRDAAYLRWRFLTHPTRRYRLLTVREGSALRGYLVIRIDTILGLRSGLLVDLLVENSPVGTAVARSLIRRANQLCREQSVALVSCLMPRRTPGARALWSSGFCPCPKSWLPQPFPVTVRSLLGAETPSGLTRFSDWYLTMGDYDAV